MNKLWSDRAWNDYLEWRQSDLKILDRINALIKDIERNGPAKGIGKPEKLKHKDGWSRRIDGSNRLTYDVSNGILYIHRCKGHYDD